MSKKLTIGLFGFGVVGQGLHDIIRAQDLNLEIKKIAIKNPEKKRSLDADLFTTNHDLILENPEINTVIELIDDADAAYHIVSKALKNGKNVVSANKKMIAYHLKELLEIQKTYGTSLIYEGAVCGSIPIIRNLEEYYNNELLDSVSGICNGSSNYILSKIFNENLSYQTALKQAQDLGFAESNPILDVGGFDPKFKLLLLVAHAYGIYLQPDQIFNYGIQNMNDRDILYVRANHKKLKLVPTTRKLNEQEIVAYVTPRLIGPENFLYNVENEYNGVIVQGAFSDQQFFFGKGAGGHPTGSAVLSDIAALRYDYRYEYNKNHQISDLKFTNDTTIEIYLRYEDEQLVEKLQFDKINERYAADDYKYVVGKINLQQLIKHQDAILHPSVFLIATGN